ncbi:GtrA family protein [Colidextribacter sp. OB.20]|uniref:GtrA family protein n=1 Tax=Colidextribacter sp. OB.20 TaxID=2304568 RepID=UPI00136B269B|nr:GtrA family protein [Colidextribacter sp. OB.20]NBI10050.1 GtrA family protein [Colidextribacter sp. OB.20]
MIAKMKALAATYREQLAYLVVGVITTIINYAVYLFFTDVVNIHYIASNIIAWVAAVAFAYFANGKWVYCSTSRRSVKEAFSFVLSRLFSLGLETVCLFLLVDLLHVNQRIAKLLMQVMVTVVNYLTGLLVFKHK